MKYLEPFIFYDLQARYAPAALLSMYIEYDSTLVQTRTEQGIIGYEMLSYLGPFTWIEQNVGLGFKAPLTERFYLKQRFGVGVNMILGYDDSLVSKRFSWFDWEFSTLMHFSVGYTLK